MKTTWMFVASIFWLLSFAGAVFAVSCEIKIVEIDNKMLTITKMRPWGRILKKLSANVDDGVSIYSQKLFGSNSAISWLVVDADSLGKCRINDFVDGRIEESERVAKLLRLAASQDYGVYYRYECLPHWKWSAFAMFCAILACRTLAQLFNVALSKRNTDLGTRQGNTGTKSVAIKRWK